jgi:hypothetical protein
MCIDGDLRRPFRFAALTDRLTNYKSPALQAWMLAGRDHIAFDAG